MLNVCDKLINIPITHHVETNECHDNHVELFVGDDGKDDCLRLPCRPWQSFGWLLRGGLLHGRDVLLLVFSHERVQGASTLVLLLVELVDDDTDQ